VPRRAAAYLAIVVIVAGAAAIALFAAAHPSYLVAPSAIGHFPSWLSGPLHLPGLIPAASDAHARTFVTVVLLVMGVAWLAAVALAEEIGARALWGAVIGAHALALLAPPVIGTDVYNYLGYARLQALHHINPYVHGMGAAPHDALYVWTSWHQLTSPYGPLFTLLVEPLGHVSIGVGVWALKLLMTAASLAALWLVWVAAGRLGRSRQLALAVCGLSPLWLIFALGGFHNDLLAAAALAGAVALVSVRRPARAGVALIAGAAVKLTSVLLAPLLVLGSGDRRGRLRALAAVTVAVLAVVAVALIVYGAHPPSVSSQSRFVISLALPNDVGWLLGLRGVTPGVRLAFDALVVVTLLVGCVRVWRGADWLTWSAWVTLALLASLTWLMPWYVVWLLPLAALARSRAVLLTSLAMSAYELVMWAPDTHTSIVDALGLHAHNASILRNVDIGRALHDSVAAGWPIALAVAAALLAAALVAATSLRTRRSAP